jgi:hypothetical protein
MTDKEILKGFQEQFQTGRLLTESNVLVLMGYARREAKKEFAKRRSKAWTPCEACGHQNSENCNTCTIPESEVFSMGEDA